MPQSFGNITVHLVFSTKERRTFLQNPTFRHELFTQIGAISKTMNCPLIIIGGAEDHVHILGNLARTISIAEWVKELKRVSSIWVKQNNPGLNDFQWQAGYAAFSVSQSQKEHVIRYIKEQETHHRKFDFKSEFRSLLERHEIEFDENYVWD